MKNVAQAFVGAGRFIFQRIGVTGDAAEKILQFLHRTADIVAEHQIDDRRCASREIAGTLLKILEPLSDVEEFNLR